MKNKKKIISIAVLSILLLGITFLCVHHYPNKGESPVTLTTEKISENKVFPTVLVGVNQNQQLEVQSETSSDVTFNTTKTYLTENGQNIIRVNVTVDYVDGVTIEKLKWASGEQSYEYMAQNGTDLTYTTGSNRIETSFKINQTGKYTIFIQYAKGDQAYQGRRIMTINSLVNPSAEYPNIEITRNKDNGRKITIHATNQSSKITTLKIQKVASKDETVDFNTQGTSIDITASNDITVDYTVAEDGIYKLYAKSEAGSYSTLTTVLAKDSIIVMSIDKDKTNGRKITITATDGLADIQIMKIAKASDVTGTNYFETNGTSIPITAGRTVTGTYTVPEDGNYIIYVKDALGNTSQSQVVLSSTGHPIVVSITQDSAKDTLLHITAKSVSDPITVLKVALGQQEVSYFENNGTVLAITPGTEVSADYTLSKSSYVTVYAETASMKYVYRQSFEISTNVPVQSVSLNKTETSIQLGKSEKLVATINPSNATNTKLNWSSSQANVASVDDQGNVTAKAVGTTVVKVISEDGQKEARCTVTVTGIPVESVSLNKTETSIQLDKSEKLVATINPSNATNTKLNWSSSQANVASVDDQGNVTAKAVGTTVVKVISEDGQKEASCTVTVTGIPVESVSLNKTETSIQLGKSEKLVATINPSNATNTKLNWSSSQANVASVDDQGNVTAKSIGTTVIKVISEDGQKEASCTVTVTGIPVESVSLNKTETSIQLGKSEKLVATINPSNATNTKLNWSSSQANVASVDDQGNVTAKAVGTTVVKVISEDGQKEARCTVTVTGIPVESVSLNKTETSIQLGKSEKLVATINPSNATNTKLNWSSSQANVASVDDQGNVTAKSVGTTVVKVISEDGQKEARCTVTVTGIPVESVSLNKTETSIQLGKSEKLVATINPSNATNTKLNWSSSQANVASVDDQGNVTAKSIGTTVIKVISEDGQKEARCTVTVTGIPVESVSLNKTETSIQLGKSEKLVATINPSNATNTKLNWSSSQANVASVDDQGNVTAKAVGTTVVKVISEDGQKEARCTVTVTGIPVESVSLNKTETSIQLGKSEKLVATINPSNATNTKLNWSSSQANVASVDDQGNVTAKAVGTTVVKVISEDGQKEASCTVTVTGIPVESVSLNKTETSIQLGKSEKLVATINPSNATNTKLNWSSSQANVASVDDQGNVTAKAVGTTVVKVISEDGQKEARCTVTVTGIPVESVSLNKTETSIQLGKSEKLVATINPSNATNTKLNWSSSQANVASVDDQGNVTAKAVGTTVVKVISEDGQKEASCTVTVTGIPVESVSLNKTETSIQLGKSEKLVATINPSNATNTKLNWSSSQANVASVDDQGNVTAKSVGTTVVKVISEDGQKEASCSVTVEQNEEPVEPDHNYQIEVTKQLDGKQVNITIQIQGDASQIKKIKFAQGTLGIEDFQNGSGAELTITGDTATAMTTENGTYTIYIEDNKGNAQLKQIKVTEIPNEEPQNPSHPDQPKDDNNPQNPTNQVGNQANQTENNNSNGNNGVKKLPFTGSSNQAEYCLIGAIAISLLTGGIVLIRKYVL